MRVLVITGDRSFGPGHPRYELQRAAVEALEVLFVGRGSWWPVLPQGNFDVVTTQDPFWRGLFAWYAAHSKKTKLNVQVHADLSAQSFAKHVLAQIVLRHAGSVRVVSEKIKNQAQRFGVHAPITVLPVFVDLTRFTHTQHSLEPQPTILWVGRFEDEKDPLFALEVFKQVRITIADAKLVMLGTGSLFGALQTRAHGLPVEFPGWQDPLHYMPQAGVVLSTSRHESWGASIVEALAAGVPVVAPDVGVAREAGATVVPRNELAQATVSTLQSKARGTLMLTLLSQEEWVEAWKRSLQ